MNGSNGFNELDADRRIADWLENGPTTLSSTTSRAIRVAIHTAPRKRSGNAPWRYLLMPVTRIALGATLIGVVLFGGFVAFRPISQSPGESPAVCDVAAASLPFPSGSATSSGSPQPTAVDTSTWVRFTSSRYGYSICAPSDWTTVPGSAPGIVNTDTGANIASTDTFLSPDKTAFVATSELEPAGVSEADWFASYSASARNLGWPSECWPRTEAEWSPLVIDGEMAHLHAGLTSCNFTEAIVFWDGRIYTFLASPYDSIVDQVFDWGQFYAFLDTVKLLPAAADDMPAASPGASPS
jgi:hypothetical protein